jgi:ElaB/YqjD/DUF883 family membrane-anchored ribosome-binding protein
LRHATRRVIKEANPSKETQTMASKTQNKAQGIQEFVVAHLEDARKQLVKFEKELAARGKHQRKEIEAVISQVKSGRKLKALKSQANEVGSEVRKRLDGLQGKLVEAVGVASVAQVKEINRELSKLAKKLETLTKKKSGATVN